MGTSKVDAIHCRAFQQHLRAAAGRSYSLGSMMMRLSAKLLFTFLLPAVASSLNAKPGHYDCVVLSANALTDEGALDSHWTVKTQIGEKFKVDRLTGRVLGGPLDNSSPSMSIVFFDGGSQEMPLQAFARSSQHNHTTYIKVNVYQRQSRKPFLGHTTQYAAGVYSGMCD